MLSIWPFDTFTLFGRAVRRTGEIPDTDWLAKPGPEASYVTPWILEHPSLVAVVSTLPIGGIIGCAAGVASTARTTSPRFAMPLPEHRPVASAACSIVSVRCPRRPGCDYPCSRPSPRW